MAAVGQCAVKLFEDVIASDKVHLFGEGERGEPLKELTGYVAKGIKTKWKRGGLAQ
jgi:hypothetical protein